MNILVVGCGITGAVISERLAQKNNKITLIDKKKHIAGNCYDYIKDDVMIQAYGPHIFHTDNKTVWDYLSRFTEWQPYMHKVLAYIDGMEVPVPFNFNTLYKVFPLVMAQNLEKKLLAKFPYGTKVFIMSLMNDPDSEISFLAEYVYEKIFKNYTMKQWGLNPEDIDAAVTARVPLVMSRDDRYFQNKYQGIPKNGYTNMIQNIINHPNIVVKTGFAFKDIKNPEEFDKIYFTGPIDEYYNYKYGYLPYRSLRFDFIKENTVKYQSVAVVNYPNNYDYTRITEFKHFLSDSSEVTYLLKEYPEAYQPNINEPLYPILNDDNKKLYEKYLNENKNSNIIFAGRLAEYKYYDMDKAVESVLSNIDSI